MGLANTIRYDTRCYFNMRSKADISQFNLLANSSSNKTAIYYPDYTSCCITDSKRLHCCCHLPNKVGNIDHTLDIPCSTMSREISPILSCTWGTWSPVKYIIPCTHLSPSPKRHLNWFRYFSTAHGDDKQTHRPRYNYATLNCEQRYERQYKMQKLGRFKMIGNVNIQ